MTFPKFWSILILKVRSLKFPFRKHSKALLGIKKSWNCPQQQVLEIVLGNIGTQTLSSSLHSMHLGPKIFGVHLGFFSACGVQTNEKTFCVHNLFSSWRAKLQAAQA